MLPTREFLLFSLLLWTWGCSGACSWVMLIIEVTKKHVSVCKMGKGSMEAMRLYGPLSRGIVAKFSIIYLDDSGFGVHILTVGLEFSS